MPDNYLQIVFLLDALKLQRFEISHQAGPVDALVGLEPIVANVNTGTKGVTVQS